MNTRILVLTAVFVAASASWTAPAWAAPKVKRIDENTLLITDFAGKPPFKRQSIARQENAELYAHYAQRVGLSAQPLMAVESRRVPGKNLPGFFQRISSDAVEIAEFARFEETEEPTKMNARSWSGAPGKGRRAR